MGGESDRWGFNGAGCVWLGGGGGGSRGGGEDGGSPTAGCHHTSCVPALLMALFFLKILPLVSRHT